MASSMARSSPERSSSSSSPDCLACSISSRIMALMSSPISNVATAMRTESAAHSAAAASAAGRVSRAVRVAASPLQPASIVRASIVATRMVRMIARPPLVVDRVIGTTLHPFPSGRPAAVQEKTGHFQEADRRFEVWPTPRAGGLVGAGPWLLHKGERKREPTAAVRAPCGPERPDRAAVQAGFQLAFALRDVCRHDIVLRHQLPRLDRYRQSAALPGSSEGKSHPPGFG